MSRILAGTVGLLTVVAVLVTGVAVGQTPVTRNSEKPALERQSKGKASRQSLPKLVLPNTEKLVKALERADYKTLVRQQVASANTIAFWKKKRWILAPRKEKCWEVPWQRSCTIARHSLRMHTRLSETATARMDAMDPIITRLNAGLRGTPMAGLGKLLRDVGRRYDVSPFFMAAAAGTESSFGFASCSGNRKNVWGLAACDGRWHVPYFDSWEEAIEFYANFLASRWSSHTTTYSFRGYAACDACWGRKTASWMSSRFGVGNYTRYPSKGI